MIHVFDIDGTILSASNLVRCLGKELNGFKESDLVYYNINKSVVNFDSNLVGFDVGEFYIKYSEEILYKPEFTSGFIDYIKLLESRGEEFIFVTARRPSEKKYTERKFKENKFLCDYLDKVYHLGLEYGSEEALNKNNLDMNKTKVNFLKDNLNLDLSDVIIYEDRIDTCEEFLSNGSLVYLIKQSYNSNSYVSFSEGINLIEDFRVFLNEGRKING